MLDNDCYCSFQKLKPLHLLSTALKIKIYKTVILKVFCLL